MSSYGSYILTTLAMLVGICALAVVVLYGARRFGIGRRSGPLKLVGHLPLDARRAIYLLRVGDRSDSPVFVVAAGEGGFAKIGEVTAVQLESTG